MTAASSPPSTPPGRPPTRRRPGDWVVPFWLVAAAVVALTHTLFPESTWLMVHLVMLGALTHAAVVWSEHFAQALLRTKAGNEREVKVNRYALAAGTLLVLVGVPTAQWWLTLSGAVVVSGAVLWHGWRLWRDLRAALPGRFRVTIHYYLAAALWLPVGAGLGATMAHGQNDDWHARLLVAHTVAMLLGWVGLTVVGTLVTFWPTVLRTQMDPRADRLARRALPVLLVGLAVADAGALLGWRWVIAAGLMGYVAGLLWVGRGQLIPLRKRPPREYASAAIGLAQVWFVVAVVATGGVVAWAPDARALTNAYPFLAAVWVGGFALQLLTGALSYLLPSVLGGGPSVVRAGNASANRYAATRLTIINLGLPLWLAPIPSWAKVTVSAMVLAAYLAYLPLGMLSLRASLAERRRLASGEEATVLTEAVPSALTSSGLIAGVTALALAVAVGVALDPVAAGLATVGSSTASSPGSTAGVTATGRTVEVTVSAADMKFTPNTVTAHRGDRIIVHLTNADPTTTHDLTLNGATSKRLAPGESTTLDAGLASASTQGYCTVVGHRSMGMVFDLVVTGSSASASAAPTASAHAGHGTGSANTPLTRTVDANAPATPAGRTHQVTLRVQEVPLEVAPGVWQTRWTYNGASVGPTLRGKVGDAFEVTLLNDGSMGHSIDFHAGEVAPDQPMRTIPPGESLVYRFTATHSGAWLYHCSTMPMTAHIAAGMHGAVIIDPEGLEPVAREYVLVQSEVYLTSAASAASDATEVNAEAATANTPNYVAFNGVASQYDQQPLTARVGDRVRIWIVDAGPNRASSFHVVGGQFDTVFSEGAYQLKRGRDAFGATGGGAQSLAVQPGQGGFVELVVHEAGHYPFVTHIMADAEHGAHGILAVTP